MLIIFQIASAMSQLFEIDFRVRTQIFQCLEHLASETMGNGEFSIYQEVCMQLAFCYKIGFGTPRAEELAESFLAQSKKHQAFDSQIMALKHSTHHGFHPTTNYNLFYAEGHISTTTDAQYYREQKLLTSVQAVHEREIMDWVHVLGHTHWIIHKAAGHYQGILENLGLFAKSEDVARGLFTNMSETMPDTDPAVLYQKFTLARATYMNGNIEMAEKLAVEIIKTQNHNSVQTNTSEVILMYQNIFLACLYAARGKNEKAFILMGSVVESFSSFFGTDHYRTLVVRWNLCEILRNQRRIKKAIVMSESLLQAATETLGEEHEFSILVKMSLTRLLWERRGWLGGYNGPRADVTLRLDHIKASQAMLGNDHPWTIGLLFSTVRNLVGRARFTEAIALQEQIATLSENNSGPHHPQTINHKSYLAYIQKMYKNYLFMEKIGSLYVGNYVLTPSLRVREGLERICWPVYRRKDTTEVIPFAIDLSNGSRQS